MEKLLQRCKETFLGRTVGFYIALGVAAVTFIVSIVYLAMFAGTPQFSAGTFVLSFLAMIVFLVLAFLGMPKTGAAFMALCSFFAVIVFIVDEYSFIYGEIANTFMEENWYIPDTVWKMLRGGVPLVVVAVLGNIAAWLPLGKRPTPDKTLYDNLQKIIKDNGLSVREFADSIAVPPAEVRSWLKGESEPGYEAIRRIKQIYYIAAEQLYFPPEPEETASDLYDEEPTEETPVEETPEEEPTEETPVEEIPAEEPTEETPVEEIPAEEPTEETPVEEIPTEEPTEEIPAEETPVEEIPTEEPTEEIPAEETPVEEIPTEEPIAPTEESAEEPAEGVEEQTSPAEEGKEENDG